MNGDFFSPENINYILMAVAIYIAFFVGLFLIFYVRRRGSIKVRIKTPIGERIKWKKPEPDGETIIVEKAKGKKNPGWSLKFTNKSLVPIKGFFGMKMAIDVFHLAPKAIEYDYSNNEANQPKWDKRVSKEFIEAEVLRQRGRALKTELPSLFWLLFFAVIIVLVLQVIQFLATRGVRIG